MANATFRQVQQANAFTLLADDDIIPGVAAPYGVGDDGGYTGAVIKEAVRDAVSAFLVQGADISITHDDPNDTLTIAFSGTIYTDADAVNAMSNEVGANGVVVRTAADTFTARSIAAGTGLSISNGDGVSGNPTASISNALLVSISAQSLTAGDILQANGVNSVAATTTPYFDGFSINTETINSGSVFTFLTAGSTDPNASIANSNDTFLFGAEDTSSITSIVASSIADSRRAVFKTVRARGTLDSPSAAASGDFVFSFLGAIYDGTTNRSTFGIDSKADGAVSSGVAPQRVEILTGTTNTRTERMRIASGGNIYFPGAGTTASSANVFLNSGSTPANELLRSTSSVRYKRDIEPMWDAVSESIVDNLRPVFYRSKAKADPVGFSYYGLLAEDVAAIDPRFVNYGYNENDFDAVENEDGVVEYILKKDAVKAPDGIAYDRLVVAAMQEIRKLRVRVSNLERQRRA